jgi:hypothetical protein
MNRKRLVLVIAAAAVAGCTLNRSELRQTNFLTRIGGGGQVIEPKRCTLTVATLSRPLRDEAIDSAIWTVADEQAVPPSVRRAFEVNGLRIGLITGDLPADVDSILKAPPPKRVEPMRIVLPDGDHTMLAMSESLPVISLLLNLDGRAFGKDYKDASGWFRVTAHYEGETAVKLRFVPEIHHGPIQRAFSALPNAGTYSPQQFMQKDGQQEDTLRELAASLDLQANQIAVLGCRSDAQRSLGSFLFTQNEANSDRLLQKIVLIWASRTTTGADASVPPGLEPIDPPKQ